MGGGGGGGGEGGGGEGGGGNIITHEASAEMYVKLVKSIMINAAGQFGNIVKEHCHKSSCIHCSDTVKCSLAKDCSCHANYHLHEVLGHMVQTAGERLELHPLEVYRLRVLPLHHVP